MIWWIYKGRFSSGKPPGQFHNQQIGSLFGGVGGVGGGGDSPSEPLIPLTTTLFIGITGQSNASGSGATVITSGTHYAQNWKVFGNSVVPSSESSTEKFDSNIQNYLSWIEPGRASISINSALGGAAITSLNSGSSQYNNILLRGFATGSNIYNTQPEIAVALCYDQGEAEVGSATPTGTYQSQMVLFQQRLQSDLQYLLTTASAAQVPFFYVQKGNLAADNINDNVNWISYAQANVWRHSGSNNMVLVCPTYQLTYASGDIDAHYTANEIQRVGEYFGKAINKVVLSGSSWAPLHISSTTGIANQITINLSGGDGSSISADLSLMRPRHNWGFEYIDSTSASAHVVTGSISGRTINLTLNKDADSTGRIRYAMTTGERSKQGPTGSAQGGNIRDNDITYTPRSGSNLYNWLIADDVPLSSYSGGGSTPVGIWRSTGSCHFMSPGYIQVNRFTSLNSATRASWTFWIRRNGSWGEATERPVWIQGISSIFRGFSAVVRSTNAFKFYLQSGSTVTNDMNWLSPNNMFSAGPWFHIGVVFDGTLVGNNRLRFYVNGQDVSASGTYSATPSSSIMSGNATAMVIGANSQGAVALGDGELKDLALWVGTPLTYAQIGQLYNSGTIVNPSTAIGIAPTHLWRLQEDFGDWGTGSVRHGTAFGANMPFFTSSGP